MGDMVEDYAETNRRSKLPIRLSEDLPRGQARKLLWGTINMPGGENGKLQEKEITRTAKRYTEPPEKKKGATRHRRRRNAEGTEK